MNDTLRRWLEIDSRERVAHLPGRRTDALASTDSHKTFISVAEHLISTNETGELGSVPFAVKDNIDVAGVPTTGGSPLLASDVADIDAPVVSALRDAGAVVVGKTNLHELAFGATTENSAYGTVRNPLDTTRVAGGSSGGSAAAVAMGTVPFSLGTDTGGSVTIPSAFCGIAGFRPSTGRYPGDGVVNLSCSRDTIGIHARTVDDIRIVDGIVTGAQPTDLPDLSGVVLGTVPSRYVDIDPEVEDVVNQAFDELRRCGVTFVETTIPEDMQLAAGPGIEMVFYETERLLPARVGRARGAGARTIDIADLVDEVASADVRVLLRTIAEARVTDEAYERARACRWELRRRYRNTFSATGVHAFVAPTVHILPPLVGDENPVDVHGTPQPVFPTVTRNAAPGTVAGVPMLSIPGGTTPGGLSVGVCLEGRFFEDSRLLALGMQVEAALRARETVDL